MNRFTTVVGPSILAVAATVFAGGPQPPCDIADPNDPCHVLPNPCPPGTTYVTWNCTLDVCCEGCSPTGQQGSCILNFPEGAACVHPEGGILLSALCCDGLPACWVCTSLSSACPANPRVGGLVTFEMHLVDGCEANGPFTWSICQGAGLVQLASANNEQTITYRITDSGKISIRGHTPATNCEQPFQVAYSLVVPEECPGDVDGDRMVDNDDLIAVILSWGSPGCGGNPCCPADLDLDGDVNVDDQVAVMTNWGACD